MFTIGISGKTIISGLLSMALFGAVCAFAQPRTNGKIAFTSDREGNREIYVMDADGSDQVRLTKNNFIDDHPTWSPDGRKIAFVSQRVSGEFAIFLMNADGSGKTEITPITVLGYRINKLISWSPDGRHLVFGNTSLEIVDVDGSNRRFLTTGYQPAWSPDGSKILFVNTTAPRSLNTIRPDGTESRIIPIDFGFGGINGYPDWSPDGSRIAFIWGDNANQDMFVASSDGTQFFFVINECGGLLPPGSGMAPEGCGFINSLAWSPDGTKIVYGAFGNLYTVDQYGAERTVLASIGDNKNPSWQPLLSEISISGRVVTPAGLGLRNAVVTLTDQNGVRRTTTTSSFGFYTLSDIPRNATYTAAVASRRYRFATRPITADGNLTNIDFVGLE